MESRLLLRVCSISPQTLEGFSLHFDKLFSSVRGCAKHIAQPCKLKVKVTVEGNGIEHRSMQLNHDYKVVVTSGDHKFGFLILCPHPIAFTLKLVHKI